MSQDLRGRVIVITGGSSGIGAATARLCGKLGMNVALGARRVERLDSVRREIDELGGKGLAVRCDVESDSDVSDLVARAAEAFGRVDVAFANAGYGMFKSVMDTSDEEARAIFETNFFGTIRLIKAAVPEMRKTGRGHMIICSSAASEIAPPLFGHYAATKAAQDSIGGALRAELVFDSIFVTTIHPIGTQTEFFDHAATLSTGQKSQDNTPIALRSTAESVARKIVRSMKRDRPPADRSTARCRHPSP